MSTATEQTKHHTKGKQNRKPLSETVNAATKQWLQHARKIENKKKIKTHRNIRKINNVCARTRITLKHNSTSAYLILVGIIIIRRSSSPRILPWLTPGRGSERHHSRPLDNTHGRQFSQKNPMVNCVEDRPLTWLRIYSFFPCSKALHQQN